MQINLSSPGQSNPGQSSDCPGRDETGKKSSIAIALVVLALMAVFSVNALAIQPCVKLKWLLPNGDVTFDGKTHTDSGLKCTDCHDKIFNMHYGDAKMTMKALNEGKFCGQCHNGEKAFKTSDGRNCKRCHVKST
ncbi:MAG: cytochrome C [Nitrospirae bacterium]|nr:cytochrome C [Nitrospirota bacterium]